MCTYNSNSPFFKTILRKISEEIPVHCFIAIDRFSIDGSVEKILEVFPQAKIIQSKENLGRARKIGIENVDTSLFAFIDSDVLLLKGWYTYTKALMNKATGAIACFAKDGVHYNYGLDKDSKDIFVTSKYNLDTQRGWTYATLVRKTAVEDWSPDKNLCAGEDHQLLRHVVGKDFLWVTSYHVLARHIVPIQNYFSYFQNLWRKHRWNSAGRRYIHLAQPSISNHLIFTFYKLLFGIEAAFLFNNAFLIPIAFVYSFASFYGYVNWKKDIFLNR